MIERCERVANDYDIAGISRIRQGYLVDVFQVRGDMLKDPLEADVKIMNAVTHLPLLHEILASGILLCDRRPNARRDFAIKKNREYLDFLPYYQRMLDTYAERIRTRVQAKS